MHVSEGILTSGGEDALGDVHAADVGRLVLLGGRG